MGGWGEGVDLVLEKLIERVALVDCEGVGDVVDGFEEYIYCGEENIGLGRARVYETGVVGGQS